MLIWLVVLLLASYGLTFYIRKFAMKKQLMDIPNERSSHTVPTPRGGGLAIVISWFTGISVLFFIDSIEKKLYYAFLPGILLAVTSLLDDIFDLKPMIRLVSQFISVVLAIYFLNWIKPIDVGIGVIFQPYVLVPLFIIGMIWFINLYNFLDGIDGYSSMEAIFVTFSMFLFTRNTLLLILIFAVLGFLIWNWPRAKIFMGDVGSTQLGYILIVLGIYFHNNGSFDILHWIILTSLFWFDATLTLFRRWKNKEKLSQAHKKHAYQRIVQAGFSHQRVVLFSTIINMIWLSGVFIIRTFDVNIIIGLISCLIINYVLIKFVDNKKAFA